MSCSSKHNSIIAALTLVPVAVAMSSAVAAPLQEGMTPRAVFAQAQPQPPVPRAQPGSSAQSPVGLATGDHEISGIEVTLLELKRTSGDTVTARWRYRNSNPAATQLTQAYGESDPWKLSLDSYFIDGANKKKYLLLTDSTGLPIAAKHGGAMSAISVGPGQSLSTWAKYPAPPEGVKKISLFIKGVAPFEDIPISQ